MDPPTISSAKAPSSTASESCVSSQTSLPAAPCQLLEISLISAQDLAPTSKSIHKYAVTWIQPNRKHTTQVDQHGHQNPRWNDRFVFRLDNEMILSENATATVTVEIYAVSWFRNVLVGTVRVLVSDLITPLVRNYHGKSTRFVALQVRRPSGSPQGILNMGVALLDASVRRNLQDTKERKVGCLSDEEKKSQHYQELMSAKIHLSRSLRVGSQINEEEFPTKPGSVYNGSMVNGSLCNGSSVENGSELCSDIGPSASIVAAELAKKTQEGNLPKKAAQEDGETGSSILEDLTIEEARAKGYRVASKERWRKGSWAGDDGDESELSMIRRHTRRNTTDAGPFSCFGNAYGIEFTIVCGASSHKSSIRRKKKASASLANSA